MNMLETLKKVEKIIKARKPNFTPKIGIILGSGLGPLADAIETRVDIPYADLPGFPISRVPGHEGSLILGDLNGVPVMCLKGRVHMYEGPSSDDIKILLRAVKLMGCHSIILTNAVGSLHREIGPGEISLITDHINFPQANPLIGINEDEFGPRFFAMTDAYDPELRKQLLETAKEINMPLHQGVYIMSLGPSFETPAEIKAFRVLGADLVGMSIIPEVIVARHCGLKVAGISAITNLSSDLSEFALSHEQTLHDAQFSGEKLQTLIKAFLKKYKNTL